MILLFPPVFADSSVRKPPTAAARLVETPQIGNLYGA